MRPGRDAAFERFVRAVRERLDSGPDGSALAVYELVNGVESRHYLIMLPRYRVDLSYLPESR